MVVKSATKKKLMDLGVSEEHAHELAWERKWDDIKVLSPRNLLTILFGSKGWNHGVEHWSNKNPNLDSRYPLGVTNDKHLTEFGKKNLATVNRYYTNIHGIREKTIDTPHHRYGVINHGVLFKRISYWYQTRSKDGELTRHAILVSRKESITWSLPHSQERDRQQKEFRRYADSQGRLHQY